MNQFLSFSVSIFDALIELHNLSMSIAVYILKSFQIAWIYQLYLMTPNK